MDFIFCLIAYLDDALLAYFYLNNYHAAAANQLPVIA
jgi:hypothetical protein